VDNLSDVCAAALGIAPLPAGLALRPCTPAEVRARTKGIVIKPDTIDYQTRAGVPGGLFDPSVFGLATFDASKINLRTLARDAELPDELPFGRLGVLPGPLVHPLLATFALEPLAELIGASHAALSPIAQFDRPDERLEALALVTASALGERLLLEELAVVPIALRPMVALEGGRFATSDLNDLYRRVINRRNRLARLLELNAPDVVIANERRLLHEALLALFANERAAEPVCAPDDRVLASMSSAIGELGERIDLARPRARATVEATAYLLGCGFELVAV
jgi:RNA polymerase Rpb1, domain 1